MRQCSNASAFIGSLAAIVAVLRLCVARMDSSAHLKLDSVRPNLMGESQLESTGGLDSLNRILKDQEETVPVPPWFEVKAAVLCDNLVSDLIVATHRFIHACLVLTPEFYTLHYVGHYKCHRPDRQTLRIR